MIIVPMTLIMESERPELKICGRTTITTAATIQMPYLAMTDPRRFDGRAGAGGVVFSIPLMSPAFP
jgi:hypothetical protein